MIDQRPGRRLTQRWVASANNSEASELALESIFISPLVVPWSCANSKRHEYHIMRALFRSSPSSSASVEEFTGTDRSTTTTNSEMFASARALKGPKRDRLLSGLSICFFIFFSSWSSSSSLSQVARVCRHKKRGKADSLCKRRASLAGTQTGSPNSV